MKNNSSTIPKEQKNREYVLRKNNIWNLENTYLRDSLANVCSPRQYSKTQTLKENFIKNQIEHKD